MIAKKLFLIICAVPTLGMADDSAAVSGPVSGFVFDQSARMIRPVLGVPGAAYLGSALLSDVDAASVAPDGSAALAVQKGRLVAAPGIKTLAPQWTAVEGAISDADLFAWSQDAAAIYSSKTGQAQIVRNLLKSPAPSAVLDLSVLSGRVAALALEGDALLAGVEGADGGVYLLRSGKEPKLLAAAPGPVALAIAGRDLYFADRDGGRIWRIANFGDEPVPAVFAGGIDSPVGLYIAAGRLFVAGAGSNQLRLYDLASGADSGSLDLEFTPTTLDPLGARSLLLMARGVPGEQPYFVLDASQQPAVYFVPAGREQ